MNTYVSDENQLMSKHGSQSSVRDILYILFRRKWQMLVFFILVLCLGIYISTNFPVIFQSTCVLFLKPSRELQAPDPANPDSKTQIRAEQLMRSELEILRSRTLAEIIINKVGVDKVLEPYQIPEMQTSPLVSFFRSFGSKKDESSASLNHEQGEMINTSTTEIQTLKGISPRQLASRLILKNLEVVNRDTLVTLYFTGPEGNYCQTMLDAILDAYQQRRVEVYRVSPKTYQEQTERIHKELEKAEEELREYLDKVGISSVEEEKLMLLDQLSELKRGITDASVIISASETRIRGIEKISKLRQVGIIPGSSEDPLGAYIKRDLTGLMAQEAELSSMYPGDAYPVRKIREQIDRLVAALPVAEGTSEYEGVATPILQNASADMGIDITLAQVELNSEMARIQALNKALKECEDRLAEIGKHELPVKRLERKVQGLQAAYSAYLANLQKAEVYASLDNEMISNISIIQPPTLPQRPDTTLQVRIIAFSAFFAFFGCFVFAFFLSFLDHSFKTVEEVERVLGLPVLASFPKTRNHKVKVVSVDRLAAFGTRQDEIENTKKRLVSPINNPDSGVVQETH